MDDVRRWHQSAGRRDRAYEAGVHVDSPKYDTFGARHGDAPIEAGAEDLGSLRGSDEIATGRRNHPGRTSAPRSQHPAERDTCDQKKEISQYPG